MNLTGWRLARCLIDLRSQANAFAPARSTASDGTIGDTRHQTEAGGSRHNPNAAGVVTAFDLTHDPAGGMDTYTYCRRLTGRPELIPNDLDYMVSNRQIASRERSWSWRPYTGEDPHTNHAHFGVGRGPDSAPVGPYDDPSDWHFPELLQEDDDMLTPDQAKKFDLMAYAIQEEIAPAVGRLETDMAALRAEVDALKAPAAPPK